MSRKRQQPEDYTIDPATLAAEIDEAIRDNDGNHDFDDFSAPNFYLGEARLIARALRAMSGAPASSDQEWQPIDTIPRDRAVEVLSVTGIIRLAKVQRGASVSRGSIACSGDLQAEAWREAP